MEGLHVCATATNGLRGIDIWTDQSDGLHRLLVEWKDPSFILKKNKALPGCRERDALAFGIQKGNRRLSLITIQESKTDSLAKDPADMLIYRRLRDSSGL